MVRKLKELAERQEKLAQERQQDLRTPEQRWKQEQLRREAEDLRRRLAELNRQQSSGDSPSSRGGSASGQAREREERAREQLSQALESVNKALQDMQSANGNESGDQRQAGNQASRAVAGSEQPRRKRAAICGAPCSRSIAPSRRASTRRWSSLPIAASRCSTSNAASKAISTKRCRSRQPVRTVAARSISGARRSWCARSSRWPSDLTTSSATCATPFTRTARAIPRPRAS